MISPAPRKRGFAFLACVLGLGAGLLLVELLTRLICWTGLRPGYSVHEFLNGYPRYAWSQFTGPTLLRERARYNFYGNWLEINEQGYRGELVGPEKQPGVLRLIFLGGSQTFDLNAPPGLDWPHQVESILRGKGYRVEVLNAGMPGHQSWASLNKMYAELHMWSPDIVVYCEEWNDIKHFPRLGPDDSLMRWGLARTRPETPNNSEGIMHPPDRFLGWSWAYAKLRHKYFRRERRQEEGPAAAESLGRFSEWGPKQYALHLELLAHLTQELKARLVLVQQPRLVVEELGAAERARIAYDKAGLDHHALARAFSACDEVLARLAKRYPSKVKLVSSSVMNGRAELFSDHVHTTAAGSKLLAELVAEALLPLPAPAK